MPRFPIITRSERDLHSFNLCEKHVSRTYHLMCDAFRYERLLEPNHPCDK